MIYKCTYLDIEKFFVALSFTDSLGLHRIENVSHSDAAVSLHLYSPPFDTCDTFDQRTGHSNKVRVTFWSKFGERTPFKATVN